VRRLRAAAATLLFPGSGGVTQEDRATSIDRSSGPLRRSPSRGPQLPPMDVGSGLKLLRGMDDEAGDGPGAPRWPCALDRRCSYYSDSLAIDTSHVCVLVRAAGMLAADQPTLGERFGELLASHGCAGRHRLMSSMALLSGEREMNLASPLSAPRLYGELPLDALDVIESIDAGLGEDLPYGPPVHASGGAPAGTSHPPGGRSTPSRWGRRLTCMLRSLSASAG
jgi:hypothetical protein